MAKFGLKSGDVIFPSCIPNTGDSRKKAKKARIVSIVMPQIATPLEGPRWNSLNPSCYE